MKATKVKQRQRWRMDESPKRRDNGCLVAKPRRGVGQTTIF